MTDAPALLDVVDGIARVTLNRPEVGNAIDIALSRALEEVAERCARDPAIRCVVLTGAGRLFCAGGDVAALASAGDDVGGVLRQMAEPLHRALVWFSDMAKPLLTLVNGPAAGAGLSLAIAGDVVLCARSAHFTAAYGGLGLTPDGGMSWLLPRLVGLRKAQEMILGNRRVKADEAASIGLVTRLVDDERLAEEGREEASRLASRAVGALGVARGLLLAGYGASLEAQLDAEVRAIAAAGAAAEGREGLAAYAARRPPEFARR